MKRWLEALRRWRMKRWMWTLLIVGALVLVLIWVGYALNVPGFVAAGNPQAQPYQPAKNVWDWLQLLIIPTALAIAALGFNWRQSKVEREIAQDQQRENALQAYLAYMSELLLKEHLLTSQEGEPVRQVARTRTLTVLRRLDAERKTSLFNFLYEAQLVGEEHKIINLSGADLSGADLRRGDLHRW